MVVDLSTGVIHGYLFSQPAPAPVLLLASWADSAKSVQPGRRKITGRIRNFFFRCHVRPNCEKLLHLLKFKIFFCRSLYKVKY